MSSGTPRIPYSSRAELPDTHPLAAYLLHLIAVKKSNLCVSADVNSTSALLRLAEEVGDSICVLKTHADIVDDFGERTIKSLKEISRRKKFLLFEDRKFGDIGSTVQAQYTRGPLSISTWAHLTNAHIFPGPSIITALHSAAEATIHHLTQHVSTEISAGTPRPSSDLDDDERMDEDVEDYGFSAPSPSSPSSSSPPPPHHARGKDRAEPHPPTTTTTTTTSHPLSPRQEMASAFAGRKGSVVTATTTISQTIEPNARLSGSLSRSTSAEQALLDTAEPPLMRGLLLLAEMSSAGSLMTGGYTRACVEAARAHRDFVVGFVSQRSLNEGAPHAAGGGDNFLSFTPGVHLPSEEEEEEEEEGGGGTAAVAGDGLGQQYRTPKTVLGRGAGVDVVIVGRGILGAKDRRREAERYRAECWRAYEARVGRPRD